MDFALSSAFRTGKPAKFLISMAGRVPHERLREARIARGYAGPTEAADAHGWKVATYTHHENGRRGLIKNLAKYARAFHVDEEWILLGKGRGPKPRPPAGVENPLMPDLRILELAVSYVLGNLPNEPPAELARSVVKIYRILSEKAQQGVVVNESTLPEILTAELVRLAAEPE